MKKIPFLQSVLNEFPYLSKKKAYALILCGEILVDGGRVRDPKQLINTGSILSIKKREFVSRGGTKLDYALTEWGIDVRGKVFLDAGSSTGGFTDCLLKRGAEAVHSVDVGYNQLDFTLRSDNKVIVHERTNIMDIDSLSPPAEAGTADLSFRSVIPVVSHILSIVNGNWMIALIKPQFEWRIPDNTFNGVVNGSDRLFKITSEVLESLWVQNSFVSRIIPSPITGMKGNKEFLFLISGTEKRARKDVLKDLERAVLETN